MRYALTFGMLAGLLGLLGVRDLTSREIGRTAVGVVEALGAADLAALALVYGLNAAGVDVAGMSDRPIVRGLLFPYREVGRLGLIVFHAFAREPARNVLAEGLTIGRLPFDRERWAIRDEGVDAVLNLCWEYRGLASGDGLTTARVPILDGTTPSPRQFDEAVERVARWREEGRCVLIHCAQGKGRTSTVAAACLVRLGLASNAAEALAMIRAARPGAKPSPAQKAALQRYVDERKYK